MARGSDAWCDWCPERNPVWVAPDDLWRQVMGDGAGVIVCPLCFIRAAEQAGVGIEGPWLLQPRDDQHV